MLKEYWQGFISLIYPNVCLNCDTPLVVGEEMVCLRCFMDFPKTDYHKSNPNPLLVGLGGMYTLDNAFSFMKFYKKGIAQKLIHELKYNGNTRIGVLLGEWFGNELKQEFDELAIDMIIPIPLHPSKKRKRGFNQSEIIAQGIRNVCDISVRIDLLHKVRNNSTQTKKSKIERWGNVDDLYQVSNPQALQSKSVLLIDDVITTGATISVVAELLFRYELKALFIGCIATGK